MYLTNPSESLLYGGLKSRSDECFDNVYVEHQSNVSLWKNLSNNDF